MEKRNLRKLFVLLSAGVVLSACGSTTTEAPKESTGVETVEETNEAEVTANINVLIDGESLADLSQEVTVPEGTYLLDVMNEEYDVVDEGGFLSAIEGYEQDVEAKRYWMYYINGEDGSVGAGQYELEEGDQIEWRLEDSDF